MTDEERRRAACDGVAWLVVVLLDCFPACLVLVLACYRYWLASSERCVSRIFYSLSYFPGQSWWWKPSVHPFLFLFFSFSHRIPRNQGRAFALCSTIQCAPFHLYCGSLWRILENFAVVYCRPSHTLTSLCNCWIFKQVKHPKYHREKWDLLQPLLIPESDISLASTCRTCSSQSISKSDNFATIESCHLRAIISVSHRIWWVMHLQPESIIVLFWLVNAKVVLRKHNKFNIQDFVLEVLELHWIQGICPSWNCNHWIQHKSSSLWVGKRYCSSYITPSSHTNPSPNTDILILIHLLSIP